MISKIAWGSAAVAAWALLAGTIAYANPLQLTSSVQSLGSNVAVVGAADPAAMFRVSITLRMRNMSALDGLVQQHRTVSPAALSAHYLPSIASYDALCAWLIDNGLTIARTHGSRLSVDAVGSVGQLSRLFNMHFSNVVANGNRYTSADTAPSVPAGFADTILGINHLQPQLGPHKLIVRSHSAIPAANGTPVPPFTPANINQAYAATALPTKGPLSITAVIIDTLPLTSDLTAYWTMFDIPQSLSNITLIQTHDGSMGFPTGEETLDTEMASAFAPSGKIRVYGCLDLNYVDDDYEQLISDMQSGIAVTQVSISFGATREDTTASETQTEHQYFAAITAMGASVFASSGDSGIYGNDEAKAPMTLYPASDPDVTGVGATSLYFLGPIKIRQTGWSCNGTFVGCGENGASGGGLSMFVTPKFQTGIPLATHRALPDISIVGDPNTGMAIVFRGRVEQDGGTSLGAPIMAAYTGLINDTRLAAGKPTLGMLNTCLYGLTPAGSFTDITSGNNGDMAGTGYDLVTGIGTPVMSVLLKRLSVER